MHICIEKRPRGGAISLSQSSHHSTFSLLVNCIQRNVQKIFLFVIAGSPMLRPCISTQGKNKKQMDSLLASKEFKFC